MPILAIVQLEPMGDRAWIVRGLERPAEFARGLRNRRIAEIEDVVASYETVGIYFRGPSSEVQVDEIVRETELVEVVPRRHQIPVCYELNLDLSSCAVELGVATEVLIQHHLSQPYQCFAVGFSPGFGYLGYLPTEISGMPRHGIPRVSVPVGSVGITGRQTGIYPNSTPGGWQIIGRCPLELVNVDDNYFLLEAGDSVNFFRIDEAEFSRRSGERL